MKHYIGKVSTNKDSTKYLIIASDFLLEQEINEYMQSIYLLYLDENIDFDDLDVEEGILSLSIDPFLEKVSEKEFDYYFSDSTYYCNLQFKVVLFGNSENELLSIYKIEENDPVKLLETYWNFDLTGSIENDNVKVIDCVNEEHTLGIAIKEARKELAYQIRRYYPEIEGISLYSSLLCITQISQEEYRNEMDKIEECKIL